MPLFGRDAEIAQLSALLDEASSGIGGALVLVGEPGAGKTALLRAAVGMARSRGFGVVAGAGIEGDSAYGFAALARLFPELFGASDAGSELRGGVRGLATDVANLFDDGFAGHPVLVAVDDVQWLDHSSAETLRILAGNVLGHRVAILLTTRVAAHSVFDSLDSLSIGGLHREAALALLTDGRSRALGLDEIDRVLGETGGNPLALTSLRTDPEWFDANGAVALPARLDRALAGPFLTLSPQDRDTVVRVALAGPIVAAIPDTSEDLESASRSGLINARGELRHPLIRSAVLSHCTRDELNRNHEALASAFRSLARAQPHEVSWLDRAANHEALACMTPDAEVADGLFAFSERAHRRGSFIEAGRLAERAAVLHPDPLRRDKMLAQAASNAWLGSDFERANQLLDQGAATTHLDAEAHAQWAIVRVQATMWVDGPVSAREDLARVAELVAAERPDLAVVMLFTATVAATLEPNAPRALALAQRAVSLGTDVGPLGFLAELAMGVALITAGRSVEAESRLAPLDDLALALLDNPAGEFEQLFLVLGTYDMIRERFDEGLKILLSTYERTRRRGSETEAHAARNGAAAILWRRGEWARAYASMASDDIELLPAAHCLHLAQRCLLEAVMGLDASCVAHARDAIAIGEPRSVGLAVHIAHAGLGLLAIGRSDFETAVSELHAAGAACAHAPELDPGFSWWRADLTEALWMLHRPQEARLELELLRASALACNRRSATAAVARLDGLMGEGRGALVQFDAALEIEDELGVPFAAARTLLCRAEFLSARGERDDAATVATQARTRFERLGARAFADRCGALITANRNDGSVAAAAPLRLTEILSAAELRVALALADGLTARKAGELLFLSAKTVDKHLQSTYRKLGIDNRSQLARRVEAESSAEIASKR